MKVVIIGSGNVATAFGKKILDAGHEILQVVSRSKEKAASLASILLSTYSDNFLEINLEGDLYLVCVSDDAIGYVAHELDVNNKLIVHTAASVSKDVLQVASTNYGVIYPLQSLKREVNPIPPIPVLIDGSSGAVIETLYEFCSDWADTVTIAGDEERLKLHVAAVFSNNFINHLIALTQEYCNEERLNFNLLYPLIEETVKRVSSHRAFAVQTGPAVRNDAVTINKHLEILARYPAMSTLYKVLTNSIMKAVL